MASETSPAGEERDSHCQWPAEASAMVHSAPWRRLVVLGDSVAVGIGERFPGYRDVDGIARVVEALRAEHPSFEYHNLGKRDLRIAEVRASQLHRALELRPDLVIIAAGGNDILGRSFDEELLRRELRSIAEPLVAQGAQLVTMGLFDLARSGLVPEKHAALMAERFDRLDVITAQVAAECGGAHTQNHRHPCAADPEIFASDRIHANSRGHAIAAVNLIRALVALSGATRAVSR